MLSKISFSPATFRHTLYKRSLFVWLACAALLLLSLLGELQGSLPHIMSANLTPGETRHEYIANALYWMLHGPLPIWGLFYGGIVAFLCFSPLFGSQSTRFYHSLPLTRGSLFFSQLSAGALMLLIPVTFAWLGVFVYTASQGILAYCWTTLLTGYVAALGIFWFCFALGSLSAMLTGNGFFFVGLYLALHFAIYAGGTLCNDLFAQYLTGYPRELYDSTYGSNLAAFSPVVYLMRYTEPLPALLYGLVGFPIAAFSGWLYTLRRSEVSGDMLAFRPLKPLFRAAFTLVAATFITVQGGFSTGLQDLLPFDSKTSSTIVFMIVGFLAYFLSVAISEKTLRVFRKGLKGVVPTLSVALAFILLLQFDAFGYGSIPAAEDVAFVQVSTYSNNTGGFLYGSNQTYYYTRDLALGSDSYALKEEVEASRLDSLSGDLALQARKDAADIFEETENVQRALALHQALAELEQSDTLRLEAEERRRIDISYLLRDGSTLRREYPLYLSLSGDMPEPERLLAELYNSQEQLAKRYMPFRKGKAHSARVFRSSTLNWWSADEESRSNPLLSVGEEEARLLQEALIKDLDENNLAVYYGSCTEEFRENATNILVTLDLYASEDSMAYYEGGWNQSQTFVLLKSATHTLEWLDRHQQKAIVYSSQIPEEKWQAHTWYQLYRATL